MSSYLPFPLYLQHTETVIYILPSEAYKDKRLFFPNNGKSLEFLQQHFDFPQCEMFFDINMHKVTLEQHDAWQLQ